MGLLVKETFCVLLTILVGYVQKSDAVCAVSSNGIYTFGPNCQYMCHCSGGGQCDGDTGDCSQGCDADWFGPGCQFRDLAFNEVSRHLDNVPQSLWASRANDGDLTTCSETNVATTSRSIAPWWRVWLPRTETIWRIEFVTEETALQYFSGFKVTVENAPESQSTVGGYYPPESETQLCYEHSKSAPTSKTIQVTCDKPLAGNQVRIQLASTNTQLVLCDVRINSGRNVAFMKQLTRSSVRSEDETPPSNAVDGGLQIDFWKYCFVTEQTSQETLDWLVVDLGYPTFISLIRIIFQTQYNYIRYYKLYVSNTTGGSDAVMVHDDAGNTVPTEFVTLAVTGQFVNLTRSSASPTVICEIEIYGGCPFGKYGDCTLDCSANCLGGLWYCSHVNGACLQGCVAGWQGQKCDIECQTGFWGENCEKKCGNCLVGTCNRFTGNCEVEGCAAGFQKTQKCVTVCDDYTYGINCNRTCNSNCDGVCDKINGLCSNCNAGWKGSQCTDECHAGFWGKNCLTKCGNCFTGTCNRVTGNCEIEGCAAGFKKTTKCLTECEEGSYGLECQGVCSVDCKIPSKCNNVDGDCGGCAAGKQGSLCDKDCDSGSYGEGCLQTCGACAKNETCDVANGHCLDCSRGYKHSQFCNEECEDGTHGDNCTGVCGNCKSGTVCEKVTGFCLEGCAEGYKPSICQEALPKKGGGGVSIGGVVGGVVGALVVIAIVVIMLVLWRRRKKRIEKQVNNNLVFDSVITEEKGKKKESQTRDNVYINSVDIRTESRNSKDHEQQKQSSPARKTDVPDLLQDDSTNIYYNEGPVVQRNNKHAIEVSKLEAYVKKRITDKNGFVKEFESLPVGLQHPTSVAKKAGNMGKNRYKAMYAYDHSRVVLKTLPDLPDSDYINACFIKGYFKDKAYIAAQGPTDFNIDEFWRMIWEKDVFTIVMVTRLVEDTKTKCNQYWAEEGESLQFGSVIVRTESEDVFAEYCIRQLVVSHEDEQGKVRHVTQFHYTAWPDKDVPRSTSSLLHFWYMVRKKDENKSHHWLVHCSAGVGRTGTFIAIDLLYDQGTDQGCIDVFQCVKDLRDQRVSMVQTKEQYSYLHSVMVEALVLPWKPVRTDDVQAVYRNLQDIDRATGKTKLLLQYETLLEETDSGSESEDVDEMYTSAKHTENRNKNRYDNILAPNDYRPFLFTQVDGCTNYINAVYIPSYVNAHGYILTQTPLGNTAVDCCRLVFEQEVSVVVTFDESTSGETGVYLPQSGSIKNGPFTVTLVSEEDRGHYSIKTHKLSFGSKEHSFTQLACKAWPAKRMTPTDPNKLCLFLQEIEFRQGHAENKPVLAQCLNGAERSGLIVVLMNIIERIKLDNEVSVPQVIRQLRIRRQQIIPHFEQFKFCYEVLHSHVENSATYANV